MNLKTRFNLWKLKRSIGPSQAFKASLRKDLSVSWDAKYGNKLPWYQLGMRHAAAGFTAITLILTGAGGVYAYNSSEVTEGTALYPVKQVIETVEEIAKITPEAKAKFYLKKIERREAERKILEKKNPLPEVDEEVEDVEDVKEEIEEKEIKVEVKEKQKVKVIERKINRTKKSIEKTEEKLEKTRQIIEKSQSKDIKLREELNRRAEQRLEEAKKQMEIRSEKQEERKENLQELIQNRNIINIEERSRIKIEGLNQSNN